MNGMFTETKNKEKN